MHGLLPTSQLCTVTTIFPIPGGIFVSLVCSELQTIPATGFV